MNSTLPADRALIAFHPSRLRTEATAPLSASVIAALPHWDGTAVVADRTWRLVLVPAFPLDGRYGFVPFSTLLAGLMITALTVLYLYTSARRNQQLRVLADDLGQTAGRLERESAELIGRDVILEAIMHSADELLRDRDASVSMPRVLEHIGRATRVSRSALFEFAAQRDGRLLASMRYEWCSVGVSGAIANPLYQNLDLEAIGLHDWLEAFGRQEALVVVTGETVPALRAAFAAAGVRSALLVSIVIDGELWGVMSFTDCTIERQWSHVHVDTIKTLATLIGSAVARAQTQRKLAYAGRIVEKSPTLLFHIQARPGFPLTYLSSNVEQYGYAPDELQASPRKYLDLIHPQDVAALFRHDRSAQGSAALGARRECRIRRRDGSFAWFEARVNAVRSVKGRLLGFEGLLTDVSERKIAEEKIAALARTDALTGLANRASFLDQLAQAFAAARRGAHAFAVLFLDLDHFKEVNDSLGHPAGDALLRSAASRIVRSLRQSDITARFGGDEFAILLPETPDLAGAGALAGKIRTAIAEPFTVADNRVHITASIGIALYAPDLDAPEEILAQADRALYRAKEEGRDQYRFHSEDLDRVARERVSLAEDLRAGIERGELEIHYQPQVAIATGAVVGMEALVRWRHPVRGLLGPNSFVQIAERTGSIVALGQWVLDRACEQFAQWRAQGIAPPVVAVNLSGVQLKRGNEFERDVMSTLRKWRLAPSDIEFDVSEATLSELRSSHRDMLRRLRALGVGIAVDDFGAEFTAIAQLNAGDVKRIKIAPQFVAAMTRSPADATVVHAMISLAHELGLEVIAEGVETEGQSSFLLAAADSAQAQGFFFSRPLGAEDATAFLRGRLGSAAAAVTKSDPHVERKSLPAA